MGRGAADGQTILDQISDRLSAVHLSYRQEALRGLSDEEVAPLSAITADLVKALTDAGAISDPTEGVESGLVDFCYQAAERRCYSRSRETISRSVYRYFTHATSQGAISRIVEEAIAPHQEQLLEVFEAVRRRAGIGFSEAELRQHLQSLSRKQIEKGIRKVWWSEDSRSSFFSPLSGEENLLEALTDQIYFNAQGWGERRERKLIDRLALQSFVARVGQERVS